MRCEYTGWQCRLTIFGMLPHANTVAIPDFDLVAHPYEDYILVELSIGEHILGHYEPSIAVQFYSGRSAEKIPLEFAVLFIELAQA